MIKHVSSVLVLSTLLVGCGGSDSNDKKPPKSSAAVSSSSVAVSSSAPASSVAPSSVAPSSVATSSSEPASSSSSSGPEVIDAVMTTDVWRGNSDGVVSGSNLGITLVATADGQGAVFDVAAPRLLEGATIEMVVNVSNEYQASGADLQVFAQIKDNASYPGEYDCYTPNAQLTPGTDQVIECVIDESDKKFNQTNFDVQVGIQGKLQTGTIAGTVVIKSAKITLAAQSSSSSSSAQSSSVVSSASNPLVDFEADAPGTVYAGIAWSPESIIPTVVSIASVTGLPANGASTKVLKVEVTNYNSAPLFNVTIPENKSLNDYNVKVDAYFPRNTLGLTAAGGNYFKPFLFFAGTTLTGAANDTAPGDPTLPGNPGFQSKFETVNEDVDVWKTFTFTADPTKGAILTGNIQIALGINREATTNDAYYLDNVRLEPK
jgi:hypothetical protein